jgi:hypothetical protein
MGKTYKKEKNSSFEFDYFEGKKDKYNRRKQKNQEREEYDIEYVPLNKRERRKRR